MKTKKIFSFVLCLLVLFSTFFCCLPAFAKESVDDFKGTRKVVLTIDRSDLNNYINGGHSFFDFILRSNAPSWLKFSMKAENRDINISLEFSFNSYDDYKNKTDELLGGSATISCFNDGKELFLIEGFTAQETLMFIYHSVSSAISYQEITLNDLFKVKTNKITVNGKEYKCKERLEIFPKDEKLIKLDSLNIATETDSNGYFSRTISAIPDESSKLKKLVKRFKNSGKTETDGDTVIVNFKATSLNELNELTGACLYIACGTVQTEKKLKGIKVGVTQTESFGIESLLSENGSFSYSYTCPEYYKSLKAIGENVTVEDNTVSTDSSTEIKYYYEQDFSFNRLDVQTDLTNMFGKIKKSIVLSVQSSRALPYHKDLIKAFKPYMEKGVTLNIYDEGSIRYYQFTYSSFSQKSIDEFTRNILGNDAQFALNDSWIAFGKSSVEEAVGIKGVTEIDTPPQKITVAYILPKISKLSFSSGDSEYNFKEKRILICDIASDKENQIIYRRFNLVKCFVDLVVLILIIVVFILVKRGYNKLKIKIADAKKRKKEKKQKTLERAKEIQLERQRAAVLQSAEHNIPKPAVRYCVECGAPLEYDGGFCEKCGAKNE